MVEQEEYEYVPCKLVVPLMVCGYISGIALTAVWYATHAEHRQRDLTLRWYAIVLIVLLGMMLCYSRTMRCIVTLALPSLCSSRGRALLIAIAFWLAASGPVANILANALIMLRSLSCGQELLRLVIDDMLNIVVQPVRAIKSAVSLMLHEVDQVMQHVMELLQRIQGYMLLLINTLIRCAAWLQNVVELCNKQLGTPWVRCQQTAESAMQKCRAKLGLFKPLCQLTKLFLAICYPAKLIDAFCEGFWDLKQELLNKILDRYKLFVKQIEQMFDAKISFDDEFSFDTNASRSLSDVAEAIAQDINRQARPLLIFYGWLDIIVWLAILAIFMKASYFYLRYMHSKEYQNVYVTKPLLAIDKLRQQQGANTVLPLNSSEQQQYLKLTSSRLTHSEWLLLAQNIFFLLISCLQLFCICFLDYSLYWLLATWSYYGQQQAGLEMPAFVDLEVEGGGIVGDIMRGIVNAFRPITQQKMFDVRLCLPLPRPPSYARYAQLGGLCLCAWLVLLCEPYVLRIRHVIMYRYYPQRAQQRAVYLHNKILTDRVGFFKFARRKARAAFMYQDARGHISCLSWLRGKLHWCWCCRCVLGGLSEDICIVCATPLTSSTRIRCDTPNCKGIYCEFCFSQSKNVCCLCHRPIDYGDYSDFSEVQDSSDDAAAESFDQYETRKYCAKSKTGNKRS